MKKQANEVKGQVLQTIATLITTAFGLIAALAWNEAIKAIILQFLPKGSDLWGLLIYAVVITIIAVVATIIIGRAISQPEEVQLVKIVDE
ncbi:MAG: hypothetical protein B655_2353 [Methanobacterium sp. Maddingley MBC34]|jgi:hypothetical protein|uniref:DUF5654 family protein n=1 Tax=uncultured Methanobacterium sp. TaxID=176306 RepID=UPI000297978A|nr:DUF5654 family protein [uncultured Methanobacterium sp.]EKQ50618.1 MAG: hypothetical protein B655_2353 [Methanobacterium sp. Maddingley MBC34]